MKKWFWIAIIPQHEFAIEKCFELLELTLVDVSFEVEEVFQVLFEHEIVLFAKIGSIQEIFEGEEGGQVV